MEEVRDNTEGNRLGHERRGEKKIEYRERKERGGPKGEKA